MEVGVVVFCVAFAGWAIWYGGHCGCPEPGALCYRREFYGVQLNHLALFGALGFIFPDSLATLMCLGAAVELLEWWADRHEGLVTRVIGGCLSRRPAGWVDTPPHDAHVFAGEEKALSPIDKLLGVRNSRVHAWHGSGAEVIANGVGLVVGRSLRRIATGLPLSHSFLS